MCVCFYIILCIHSVFYHLPADFLQSFQKLGFKKVHDRMVCISFFWRLFSSSNVHMQYYFLFIHVSLCKPSLHILGRVNLFKSENTWIFSCTYVIMIILKIFKWDNLLKLLVCCSHIFFTCWKMEFYIEDCCHVFVCIYIYICERLLCIYVISLSSWNSMRGQEIVGHYSPILRVANFKKFTS